MAIQFFGSPRPTIGVEIELQLIDPETRDLTPKSIQLLDLCQNRRIERVKAEITQAMVETDTEISQDVKECRAHLEKRLTQVRTVANEMGILLASSETHPFQRWTDREIYPSGRYRYLNFLASIYRRMPCWLNRRILAPIFLVKGRCRALW